MIPITGEVRMSPQVRGEYVVIIGELGEDASHDVTIQNFVRDGEEFIPVFSDEDHFEREIAGSGFEDRGILIKRDFLKMTLRGDELLVLNPGSVSPVRLRPRDL